MPVRDAAGNISCFTRMQLLYRMPLHLSASDSVLAEQDLSAFMRVPLRSSASVEMDTSGTDPRRFVSGRLAGEVGVFRLLRM